MRFPSLDEVIACNEAVRDPDELSPTAEDDDLDRVERALERARAETDPIDAAAALAFAIAAAQGFYEGNKRTALIISRWFLRENTDLDPAVIIPDADLEFGALLIKAARGADTFEAITALHADYLLTASEERLVRS